MDSLAPFSEGEFWQNQFINLFQKFKISIPGFGCFVSRTTTKFKAFFTAPETLNPGNSHLCMNLLHFIECSVLKCNQMSGLVCQ